MNALRPGRGKLTIPVIIDQIHQVILKDLRITPKSITEQLRISYDWVGSIIHKDLEMLKFSAKWVPKCLMADQNRQQCQCLSNIWTFFGATQIISCRKW